MTPRSLLRFRGPVNCLILATLMVSSTAATPDEQHILELERNLVRAWLEHDINTVSSIVAEEFQEWSFRGVRMTKADLLRAAQRSGEGKTTVEDPVVRVYGDTAIYTARVTDIGTRNNGEKYAETTCVMDVFVRRDGRWRMFGSQETRIAK